VALVDYTGFEPIQRLVAAAVIDGNPIDPIVAKSLIHLDARDSSDLALTVDPELLNDALDEAVFVDQREIEKSEQKHFEQAIRQLERFAQDKILVLRRERSSISEKLRYAKERRDQVVGSTARERIEAEIEELASRDENLERRISALESREDEVYKKWRDNYHRLRYQPPNVEVLFDATLQISRPNPETSC
jgi:predicted RNase H-like nuclease (RuvC/YqgF family)